MPKIGTKRRLTPRDFEIPTNTFRIKKQNNPRIDQDYTQIDNIESYIYDKTRRVFKELSDRDETKINIWDRACEEVCNELVSNLNPEIEAELKEYSSDEDYHAFLVLTYYGEKWLVDPTYQQFLTPDERAFSPDIMMFPITEDEEEFKEYLEHYNLPEEYHEYWLSRVFNEDDVLI